MAEAFGSTSCTSALMPKSKLLHRSESQYGFVPKLSYHGGKTPRFALKNLTSNKKTRGQEKVFNVFPRMMSVFRPVKLLSAGTECESSLSGTQPQMRT